jgi:alginate O-acetyltransferase complex protein AlgI
MGFSTITFLFYFLPLMLAAYFIAPARYRIPVLLAASYVFYIWGSPTGALVILLATVMDYLFGAAMHRAGSPRSKKSLLAAAIAANIAILFYFKYSNFFIGEINRALSSFGTCAIPWTAVIFPLGISFITFHKISYLVDIYYGKVEPAGRFTSYALYLAMFPKLAQGPIVRYHTMAEQLSGPNVTLDGVYEGGIRFCTGLAKKVLLADPMGAVANPIFAMDISNLTVGYAWLGIISYTMQIYLDFSGYSDMAIGVGRMLGFTIPENFNRPYYSQNITEHWRRWHITLGAFFREYLYIPLGGNRAGNVRTYRNLWIVFIVTGFWHGANWTYILWGAYHGFFIFIERLFLIEKMKKLPAGLKIAQFYLILCIGFVMFRSESVAAALRYLHRMFDPTAIGNVYSPFLTANLIGNREIFALAACLLICFFPQSIIDRLGSLLTARVSRPGIDRLKTAAALMLFVLSLISMINNSFSPFIYFRF